MIKGSMITGKGRLCRAALNVQVCGSNFYVLVEREGRWGDVCRAATLGGKEVW